MALLFSACEESTGKPFSPPVTRPELSTPGVAPAPLEAPRIQLPPVGPAPVRRPELDGPRQIDVYRQRDAQLDMLWVVDNSGSMANEREELGRNFDAFLAELQRRDMDFHIGVTSTDLSEETGEGGALRGPAPVMTSEMTQALAQRAFQEAVSFPDYRAEGIPSPGFEEGLRAAWLGLQNAPQGFLRDDAQLAVLVVTDEDDESFGDVDWFVRQIRAIKGPGNERLVSFAAIAGAVVEQVTDFQSCRARQEDDNIACSGCIPPGDEETFAACAEAGCRYWEMTRQLNLREPALGEVEPEDPRRFFYSICGADFREILADLARSLGGLRRSFPVSIEPDPGSLTVRVNGRSVGEGWRYDPELQAIIFDEDAVPPGGAEVSIHYGFPSD